MDSCFSDYYFIYNWFSKVLCRKKYGRYTIATIYKTNGARGGVQYYFYYFYKGKKYKGDTISSYVHLGDEGNRLFIQFLEANPNRCIIVSNTFLVLDNIKVAPEDGWEELPVYVYER